MRLSSVLLTAGIFILAGALCVLAAVFAVRMVEDNSRLAVIRVLGEANINWADADTDGLQVFVIGTAPTEAARFRALSTAGTVVDAARVIDQMTIAEADDIAPPRFSIEILRNEAGISLIGLVPASTDRDELVNRVDRLTRGTTVSDLLESADFPTPDGWEAALDFSTLALQLLPRSKISVEAGQVSLTAMTDSAEARVRLEEELMRKLPGEVELELNLSAPRPVITPFTLRFVKDSDGARFDACSADEEDARDRILAAARRAGVPEDTTCTIGLGVPTRKWSEAAAKSIAATDELGGGTLTLSDADIALIALEGTDQALFDRVVGELENSLPDVFALKAVLPKTPEASAEGPPEFLAILSPEGAVQLRGRVAGEIARQTVDSFAKARFGSTAVRTAARVDDTLPAEWSIRVLAGLEVLTHLNNGAVTVTPDEVAVRGITGSQTATADISRLLSEKLGEAQDFAIDVSYDKKLDPVLGLPTPEECEAQIADVMAETKITFQPGSADIDTGSETVMDEIAAILRRCEDIAFEIGGHSDNQGRDSMNLELSQARAETVLNELRDRRILTASFIAKGYGETTPIADNGTEEGREANRRIEFRLIAEAPAEDADDTAAAAEEEDTSNEQN
ncbi:OmpA family protein [Pseudaestuariivita atlantica]|uniref:Membrane protein n=1 Tax=Pseudaestuariivita atlantica TaxID=1317121 RepID=A0A0L1JSF9_9RHOB|nr:OmpA family protein [Pseudaestuariivita atlantica]KNG94671.1 membrane protein [Pseudaestuariivita atlantica]